MLVQRSLVLALSYNKMPPATQKLYLDKLDLITTVSKHDATDKHVDTVDAGTR